MTKILYIISGLNHKGSFSLRLGNQFIDEYKNQHPNDRIETLDLNTKKIRFYDIDDHSSVYFKGGENLNDEEKMKFSERNSLVDQFLSADKFVITVPMWNFGIPAKLKAYIDMIVMPKRAFEYSDNGVKGLVLGKKVIFFGARGGVNYDDKIAQYEMQLNYLKNIFEFIGIKNQASLAIEGTGMPDIEERFNNLIPKITELVKSF